jgi:hypothetical protein
LLGQGAFQICQAPAAPDDPGADPDVTGIDLARIPTVGPWFSIGRTGWPRPVLQLHRSSKDCVPPGNGKVRSGHIAAGGPCDKAVFTLGEIFFPCGGFRGRNTIENACI